MKKIIALLLTVCLLCTLCACQKGGKDPAEQPTPETTGTPAPENTPAGEPQVTENVDPEPVPSEEPTAEPEPSEAPKMPAIIPDGEVCAGAYMTAVLKSDGTVACRWDDTVSDETKVNGEWNAWTDIVDIALYSETLAALKADGTVVWCGGRTEERWWTDETVMGVIDTWKDVVQVETGPFDVAALDVNGNAYITGSLDSTFLQENGSFVQISMGDMFLGLRANGTVYCLDPANTGLYDTSAWQNVTDVSAGYDHAVALLADGTVVATGSNAFGQCDVSDWTDVIQICAGEYVTLGVRADGTVLAAGRNDTHALDVADWTDIARVSCHYTHTVGMKYDGTLVYAGNTDYAAPADRVN